MATKPEATVVMARAIQAVDDGMTLVVLAGSEGVKAARKCGIKVIREAYADRRYDRSGRILSRKLPRALLTDPEEVVGQALSVVLEKRVQVDDGSWVELEADTLCLHGDTPGSGVMVEKLKAALDKASVTISSP